MAGRAAAPAASPVAQNAPAAGRAAGRHVVLFHAGGVGDFVMTWPILLGAARVLAQSRVVAIVAGDRGTLAERVLRVEHRDAESGGFAALFGRGDVPERAARLLADASHVVNLVAADGSAWVENVRRLAPHASLLTLTPPPRGEAAGRHAAEVLVDQLAADAILHAGATGMLASIRQTGLAPRHGDAAGPVLLHVGSGSPAKNLPAAWWAALAARLAAGGRRARFVLGEAERERLSADDRRVLADAADVETPADLLGLWDVFRGTGVYVGGDTGPTHLAAAAGLPTVAIYGPTSSARTWGPLGPRVNVFATPDLGRLDASQIAGVVLKL